MYEARRHLLNFIKMIFNKINGFPHSSENRILRDHLDIMTAFFSRLVRVREAVVFTAFYRSHFSSECECQRLMASADAYDRNIHFFYDDPEGAQEVVEVSTDFGLCICTREFRWDSGRETPDASWRYCQVKPRSKEE